MKIFTDDKAHPIALFMAALKIIEQDKKEILTWSSEVFAHEINKKISPDILSNGNFNKIMAVKTCLVTDACWTQWEVFLNIFHSVNGLPLSREALYITDVPLPYLYNTVDVMHFTREQEFSEEVARFCATIFLHEGVMYAPPPLDFCQIFISQPRYRCKTCGQEGSALPPFNYSCPSCSKMFDIDSKEALFNFKPVETGKETTNVEISLENPPSETRTKYEEVLHQESIHLNETNIDMQVHKLLLATKYLEDQNDRLLKEVKEYSLA